MRLRTNLIGALSLLLIAAGCSSDDNTTGINPGESQNGSVFATIKLKLPTTRMSTRSVTDPDHDFDGTDDTNSSNGFEIGQDEENHIGSLTLVLATENANGTYTPIAVSSEGVSLPSADPESKVYSTMFNNMEILKGADKEVCIFVYCNATLTFAQAADLLADVTTIDDIDNTTIWAPNKFLMVNAPNKGLRKKTLPSREVLLHDYDTAEKALDLGTVDVARVAARFDFKNNNGANNTNLYPINDINDATNHIADVELVGMHPINIAKEFYTLPRVSANGTNANWTLCGVETWENFVVSPNYAEKAQTLTAASPLLKKYFYQQNEQNYSALEYTNLATFNGKDDYDENWTAANKTGYKIWRYVTENTQPSAAAQKKGVTTGVVFKAEIKNPKAESPMDVAMKAKQAVYAFKGTFYGSLENLRLVAAKQPSTSALYQAFIKVFGEGSLDYKKDESTNDKIVFDKALTDADANNANTFKIFRPTMEGETAHYYIYYVYYNRHNDNGDSNEMGNMEFGTVRNNIYKLAVTSVSEFGHTDNPGDDPDPEDPDKPDEEEKVYFKVSCRVLPWMVRVNNIEF